MSIKNHFIFLIVIQLLLVVVLFNEAKGDNCAGFTDVSTTHQYCDDIKFAKEEKWVQGYDNDFNDSIKEFKPDKEVSRPEAITMIIRALVNENDLDEKYQEDCYPSDTEFLANKWYTSFACFAKEQSIMSGYPDGTFGVNKNINFVELLKIIMKAFNFEEKDNSCWAQGKDNQWYAPYLHAAAFHGILDDVELPNQGNIGQEGGITRAFTVHLLRKVHDKREQLNDCSASNQTYMSSNGTNIRTDAGDFTYEDGKPNYLVDSLDEGGGISLHQFILKIGGTVKSKSGKWHIVKYGDKIGFAKHLIEINPSVVSVIKAIHEKRDSEFDSYEESGILYTCNGGYAQDYSKFVHKTHGEKKYAIITYKGGTTRRIYSQVAKHILEEGSSYDNICNILGFPKSEKLIKFGDVDNPKPYFEKSKLGYSQYFDKNKTLYVKPKSSKNNPEHMYIFDTKQANCIFYIANGPDEIYSKNPAQVCCESPTGKMCHKAHSGGGQYAWNIIQRNNPAWEWYQGENILSLAGGPIPRKLYNIQRRDETCNENAHWTCISYQLYYGNKDSVEPPPNTILPNENRGEKKIEMFFHPGLTSYGCVTFGEELKHSPYIVEVKSVDDKKIYPPQWHEDWKILNPKWLEVTNILDGSSQIENFIIGKMLVHD